MSRTTKKTVLLGSLEALPELAMPSTTVAAIVAPVETTTPAPVDAFRDLNANSPARFRGATFTAPNAVGFGIRTPEDKDDTVWKAKVRAGFEEMASWGANTVRWSINSFGLNTKVMDKDLKWAQSRGLTITPTREGDPRKGEVCYDIRNNPEAYWAWLSKNALPVVKEFEPYLRQLGINIILELHQGPGYNPPDWGTAAKPYASDSSAAVLRNSRMADEFVRSWGLIAKWASDKPGIIAYDLLNEPFTKSFTQSGQRDWTNLANRAIASIRAAGDHTRTIIVETVGGADPRNLKRLPPVTDSANKVVYSVHLYAPMVNSTLGTLENEYFNRDTSAARREELNAPGGPIQQAMQTAIADLPKFLDDHIVKWQKNRSIHGNKLPRIYIGEFSAPVDFQGANAFLAAAVQEFAARGFDSTYHALREATVWNAELDADRDSNGRPDRVELLEGPGATGLMGVHYAPPAQHPIVVGSSLPDRFVVRDTSGAGYEVLMNDRVVRVGRWDRIRSLTIAGRAGFDTLDVQARGHLSRGVTLTFVEGDPDGQALRLLPASPPGGSEPQPPPLNISPNPVTPPTPTVPVEVRAVNVFTRAVDFAWGASVHAESYTIARRVEGGVFETISTVGRDTTHFRAGALQPDTGYVFRISASNPVGTVFVDISVRTQRELQPPAPPGGVAVVNIRSQSVDLGWSAVSGADFYTIGRSIDGINFATISSVNRDTLSVHVGDLYPGRTYVFRLTASNAAGTSFADMRVTTAREVPAAVAGLRIENLWARAVDLAWNDNNTETGYVILMSTRGGPFREIGRRSENAERFRVQSLDPNTSYVFRVVAQNEAGESVTSDLPVRTKRV